MDNRPRSDLHAFAKRSSGQQNAAEPRSHPLATSIAPYRSGAAAIGAPGGVFGMHGSQHEDAAADADVRPDSYAARALARTPVGLSWSRHPRAARLPRTPREPRVG
jgi:hypothetical protein